MKWLSAIVFFFALSAFADKATLKDLSEKLRKIEASIEVTKTKIQTEQNIQFLPDLHFMLAELLRERAVLMSSVKHEKYAGSPVGEIDFTAEKRAEQEALEAYQLIEGRYPSYRALDRVLATIARVQLSLDRERDALGTLKKMADQFAGTKAAAKAYLEIGNIFFQKKDFEFARQNFEKVLAKGDESDIAQANHKIGLCYSQAGAWLKSLKQFENVYRQPPKSGGDSKEDLREDALIASVWPLLELSPQELAASPQYNRPIEYYRSLANGPYHFRRVLTRLSQRLEVKQRPKEAAEAALELFRLASDMDSKQTAFEAYYRNSKAAGGLLAPAWISGELLGLVIQLQRDLPPGDAKKRLADYEKYFRDIVTSQQKSAAMTKRKDDAAAVARSYEDYLTVFPTSKAAGALRLNRAEALFLAGDYSRAGQAYLDIGEKISKKQQASRKDFLESSLEAFSKGLQKEDASLLEKVQARSGYREAAQAYRLAWPKSDKIPNLRFNVAKSYYDEQQYDTAKKEFEALLRDAPTDAKAKTAALLALDCHYVRDQMKDVANTGRRLLAINGLSDEVKDAIKDAVKQADVRRLHSLAGNFESKNYAAKFRAFARKNKNSSLGEQALYEAFLSMKAQNAPTAFETGEEYVATYGDNPRAQEVLASMAQLSLILLDYKRAAGYLASYSERFPRDANARVFASQAAKIFEQTGPMKDAIAAYKLSGDLSPALKALARAGDWRELKSVASGFSGLSGIYYQGLAHQRLGETTEASALLHRVAESAPASAEEKEMVAHAAVLLAESEMSALRSSGRDKAFTPALLQEKIARYQSISTLLQTAVRSEGGRWVIASLYDIGRLNTDFAAFLKGKATSPALQTVLKPQIAAYEANAKESFEKCLGLAEENEYPTAYALGCRNRSSITERDELTVLPGAERSIASTPAPAGVVRSGEELRKMAIQEIKNGNSRQALLILSRAMELDPQNSDNETLTGVVYLRMKQYVDAQLAFQRATRQNPQDRLAYKGLEGLSKAFGFNGKAAAYRAKAGSGHVAGSDLHPWLL